MVSLAISLKQMNLRQASAPLFQRETSVTLQVLFYFMKIRHLRDGTPDELSISVIEIVYKTCKVELASKNHQG